MKTIAAIALVFALLIAPVSSKADEAAAQPSKESLLNAWERAQIDNPDTIKFEKTKDKGVYDFETTTFPYKGKLRIVNLLISKKPSGYYDDLQDYRFDEAKEDLIGIIELTLDDVDEKFRAKFRHSYGTWDRNNALRYNVATKTWYTPEKWADVRGVLKSSASASDTKKTSTSESKPNLIGILISWFPMLLLIGVWIYFMRSCGTSKQKQVIEKYLPHMERTETHMDKAEKLLEEILQTLKQKQ